jgi:hypothetical protein
MEKGLRIKIMNKDQVPLLRLTEKGEILWLRHHPTEQEFKDVVIYLFDLVFVQQARLFQMQEELLRAVAKDEQKIIQLPH